MKIQNFFLTFRLLDGVCSSPKGVRRNAGKLECVLLPPWPSWPWWACLRWCFPWVWGWCSGEDAGAAGGSFLLGCVIFPLFAMTLEGSINRAVLYGPIGDTITGNLWLYALFGGAMAGIFEECGRWAAFRLTRRWSRGPEDALMYGAGHGGIEAALLAGSMMLNNLLVSMALNQDGLAGGGGPDGHGPPVRRLKSRPWSPWSPPPAGMYLWSGFERVVAIAIHLSLSVLVYAAVRNRSWKGLVLAILLHAGVDACAILTSAWLPIAGVELAALAWAVGLGPAGPPGLCRVCGFQDKKSRKSLDFPPGGRSILSTRGGCLGEDQRTWRPRWASPRRTFGFTRIRGS